MVEEVLEREAVAAEEEEMLELSTPLVLSA
jgi:hypothetical protein